MGVLGFLAFVCALWGTIRFNSLRRKWAEVMGVGGAYLVLLGIMCLIIVIGTLVSKLSGKIAEVSAVELIMTLVMAVIGLGYMVLVMFTRCETTAQRIMFPFAACLIAGGFCFRLCAALVLHIPMESGKTEEVQFPRYIYDNDENPWELMNSGGDNANYYCQKTGETKMFYISDFDVGVPSGFHLR